MCNMGLRKVVVQHYMFFKVSLTLKLQMVVSSFAERLTGLIEGKMLLILVISAMFYDVKSCLRVSG